jgi:hypothetical protein
MKESFCKWNYSFLFMITEFFHFAMPAGYRISKTGKHRKQKRTHELGNMKETFQDAVRWGREESEQRHGRNSEQFAFFPVPGWTRQFRISYPLLIPPEISGQAPGSPVIHGTIRRPHISMTLGDRIMQHNFMQNFCEK